MSKFFTLSLILAISSMVIVDVCNAKVNTFDISRLGVFKVAVLRNQKPVVVYFTKSTCSICQTIRKNLGDFARANENDMYLAVIDVDESPEMREHFKITNIPTTQTYLRGELVSQTKGPNWVGIEAISNFVLQQAQETGKKRQ